MLSMFHSVRVVSGSFVVQSLIVSLLIRVGIHSSIAVASDIELLVVLACSRTPQAPLNPNKISPLKIEIWET